MECKNPRVVGPSDLIQKPLSSHAQSSPWCKTSPQGSAPLSEFENEASMVNLCRSHFLFGSIYGLWATLTSYNCLFNFRCCWPLLEHSIQESSDFCLSVNLLCTYTHTRILSPPVQWHTTATFLTNHLFKSKYLKQFFAQIQKLQKKCAKKRKCLELCLLKGCFKTQHPPPKGCYSLLTFGWVPNIIPCCLYT